MIFIKINGGKGDGAGGKKITMVRLIWGAGLPKYRFGGQPPKLPQPQCFFMEYFNLEDPYFTQPNQD
jgi:hypothetical protein